MEILKVISIAFIALFMFLILKDKKNEVAIAVIMATGIGILIYICTKLKEIIDFIEELSIQANIDMVYIEIVLKILAISYLASFCIEICKDAGASTIASKVELSAKILILTLAIPILMAVLNSILEIL